jgi:hypothetical protein
VVLAPPAPTVVLAPPAPPAPTEVLAPPAPPAPPAPEVGLAPPAPPAHAAPPAPTVAPPHVLVVDVATELAPPAPDVAAAPPSPEPPEHAVIATTSEASVDRRSQPMRNVYHGVAVASGRRRTNRDRRLRWASPDGANARARRIAYIGAHEEDPVSVDRPTKRVHPSDARKLVALLAKMESPGFRFCEATTAAERRPGPVYGSAFDELWKLVYESSLFIHPYAALPEDPTPDGIPFHVMGATFEPDDFRSATIDQVRRYLVLCTRGERFCDGHMAAQWASGALLAALRRFRELTART